jgi:hypothetical protein
MQDSPRARNAARLYLENGLMQTVWRGRRWTFRRRAGLVQPQHWLWFWPEWTRCHPHAGLAARSYRRTTLPCKWVSCRPSGVIGTGQGGGAQAPPSPTPIGNRAGHPPTPIGNRASDSPIPIGNRPSDPPTTIGNRAPIDVHPFILQSGVSNRASCKAPRCKWQDKKIPKSTVRLEHHTTYEKGIRSGSTFYPVKQNYHVVDINVPLSH